MHKICSASSLFYCLFFLPTTSVLFFFSGLGSSQARYVCSDYDPIFKRKLTSFIIGFLSEIPWLQQDHMRAGMIDCVCPIIMLYTNYKYLSITTACSAHTSGSASGQTGLETPSRSSCRPHLDKTPLHQCSLHWDEPRLSCPWRPTQALAVIITCLQFLPVELNNCSLAQRLNLTAFEIA